MTCCLVAVALTGEEVEEVSCASLVAEEADSTPAVQCKQKRARTKLQLEKRKTRRLWLANADLADRLYRQTTTSNAGRGGRRARVRENGVG